MKNITKVANLVLADGTVFEGSAFGADGESMGEVVFNTSMAGYQEILTDPSYKGQIVIMTYSQIGNYGINEADAESEAVHIEGFVAKEFFDFPSNWQSRTNLASYLKEHNKVVIHGIDTRALTRHIRDNGVQPGIISTIDKDHKSLLAKVRKYPGISAFDLVGEVSTKQQYKWSEGLWKLHKEEPAESKGRKKLAVYDFGVKRNILRHLFDAGFDVTVIPAHTPAEEALEMADGIVLSNGPGDPETVTYAVEIAKKLIGKKPVLGICLGHQILGLALGGTIYKLKFGHHGGNHPVMDLATGKVEITSQNHNYCVDVSSLKDVVELTHKNLYDGTEEGMKHRELPVMSLQHHPEAGPGPNDSGYIFKRFMNMVNKG
ncbi:MAG: glutamine-hydrolyzing carbamoyl-phosphate synthase small subunit [Nitrospira sp.]|nr:glutamine-hydrolyzing carbamoyl-phosphate synthase small subunit [bacterium]MBL7049336.1 glutamine-hydrolyzing carbamoyl-phosphate synthase small subunit [Nitrospira sp.]